MKRIALGRAAELTGVSYPTAARWIEQGLIQPKNYVGKQHAPVWLGRKELRELCILAQLRKVLSMQQLRKAMDYLRRLGHNPLSRGQFYAVVAGPDKKHELIKICDNKTAIQLIGKGKGQLMIPLLFDDIESCKET